MRISKSKKSRQRQGKWKGGGGSKMGMRLFVLCHTIAVETERDDGEEELNSANREVEIKSHLLGRFLSLLVFKKEE